MKKLEEFINNKYQYISLEGIDEDYIPAIENLEGMQITECCCCGCGDCAKCCTAPDCGPMENPYPTFSMYFYSEQEIVNKLKTTPEVMDIFNIRGQFASNAYFLDDITIGPLVFTERMMIQSGEIMQGNAVRGNIRLKDIITKSELTDVIVLLRLDNTVQVFGLKHTGSNGKEGSIKSSLIEISKKLTSLEKIPEVDWAQVLNVAIDNADDVYTFLVTFTLKANSLPENPVDPEGPMPINVDKTSPIRSLKSFIK